MAVLLLLRFHFVVAAAAVSAVTVTSGSVEYCRPRQKIKKDIGVNVYVFT